MPSEYIDRLKWLYSAELELERDIFLFFLILLCHWKLFPLYFYVITFNYNQIKFLLIYSNLSWDTELSNQMTSSNKLVDKYQYNETQIRT